MRAKEELELALIVCGHGYLRGPPNSHVIPNVGSRGIQSADSRTTNTLRVRPSQPTFVEYPRRLWKPNKLYASRNNSTRPFRVSMNRVHRASTRRYDGSRSELSSPGDHRARISKVVGVLAIVSLVRTGGVLGQPECHTPAALSRHLLLGARYAQSAVKV